MMERLVEEKDIYIRGLMAEVARLRETLEKADKLKSFSDHFPDCPGRDVSTDIQECECGFKQSWLAYRAAREKVK